MNTGSVNAYLDEMRKKGKIGDYRSKGTLGEQAVLAYLVEYKYKHGGHLYHSYKYPYSSNNDGVAYLGNVVFRDGKYIDYTSTNLEDEIDILYITPYRVFVIEIKAYHADLKIDDIWMTKNGTPVDKSPVWQTEKHCRHLYHRLWEVIPDGKSDYIVPIVCFVDECTVHDKRSAKQKQYIHCCILNTLLKTIRENNTPLSYRISIDDVMKQLKEVMVSCEKEF